MIVTPVGVPLSLYKWLPDYARGLYLSATVALFLRADGSFVTLFTIFSHTMTIIEYQGGFCYYDEKN